jgi:hypothetical protein
MKGNLFALVKAQRNNAKGAHKTFACLLKKKIAQLAELP